MFIELKWSNIDYVTHALQIFIGVLIDWAKNEIFHLHDFGGDIFALQNI